MATRSVHIAGLIGAGEIVEPPARLMVEIAPAYKFVDGDIINWPQTERYYLRDGEVTVGGMEDTYLGEDMVWSFTFYYFDERSNRSLMERTTKTFPPGLGVVEYTDMIEVDPVSVNPDFGPTYLTQTLIARDEAFAARDATQAVGVTNDAIMATVAANPASDFAAQMATTYDTLQTAARRAAMNSEAASAVARVIDKFPTKYSGVYVVARTPESVLANLGPMSTTLTATASNGATTLSLTDKIAPGRYRLRGVLMTVTAVSGASAPYTATLSSPLAATHTVTSLAASVSAGATTLSLTASVGTGSYLVGTEVLTITGVTGSGPYTATLAEDVTVAKASGATVTPRFVTAELDYLLCHGIGAGRYGVVELAARVFPSLGNYYLNQLARSYIGVPMLSVGIRDAGLVRGGTWNGETRHAGSFGRVYRYTTAAGATMSWTSPAATKIGARFVSSANGGGLFKVTIDGDATAANLLPTAQELVTATRYPDTILTANGGTLAPTDRVMSTFPYGPVLAGDFDATMMIADGLDETTHAVVWTNTGYQHSGSSANRAYFTAAMWSNSTTTPATTDAELIAQEWIHDEQSVASAYEYADNAAPASGGTPTFIGNVHGYDEQTSLQVWNGDNETPNTMQAGSVLTGSRGDLHIVRVSKLHHPDSVTPVADVTTTYTIDRNGLQVESVMSFLIDMSYDRSYSMFPVNGALSRSNKMDRAALLSGPNLTFTGAVDNYFGYSKSAAAWVWTSTGKVGVVGWMPDVWGFTEGWTLPGGALARVQDRSGALTKVYFAWTGLRGPYLVPAGYVKTRVVRYLFGYFPDGADAPLAAA